MAQNITLLGASYPNVPSVLLPKTGGGIASFVDVSGASLSSTDGNKILVGNSAVGKDGGLIIGSMPNNGAITGSITTKVGMATIPAGCTSGGTIGISAAEQDKIIAENIKSGVTILGQAGSVEDAADFKAAYKYWGYGSTVLSSPSRTLSLPAIDLHGRSIKAIFAMASGFTKTYSSTGTQNYYIGAYEYTDERLFVVSSPAPARNFAVRAYKTNSTTVQLQGTFFGYRYVNITDADLLSTGGAKLVVDTEQSTTLYFSDATYYITVCG